MKRNQRSLFLLHPDEALRQVIADVGRKLDIRVVHVSSWAALREAVRDTGPLALLVVDPYLDGHGAGLSPQLRHFLLDHPFITVIAALRTALARNHDILGLGRWGVAEVIIMEQEKTHEAIVQHLARTYTQLPPGLLNGILDSLTTELGQRILLAAMEHAASTDGPAEDLAARFNVKRRTLLRWCDSAGLPPPRRLLAWMRVLTAVRMLEDSPHKISDVARFSGYSSGNALRTVLLSFLGKSPKELRRKGSFDAVVAAFLAELRERRG